MTTYAVYECRGRSQAVSFANSVKNAIRGTVVREGKTFGDYLKLAQRRVEILEGAVSPERLTQMVIDLERVYGRMRRVD